MTVVVPGRGGRDVAVLHLAWAPLGPAPLRAFLDSYRTYEAGCEHELVVVFNGLDAQGVGADGAEALCAELAGTKHRSIELDGSTLDLAAYGQAMERLEHERVCVLNSYSRIRCDGWLQSLDAALRPADVGLVGASGSWMSQSSYALFHLGLPSAYRRVFADRRAMIARFQALQQDGSSAPPPRGPRAAFDTTRALCASALSFPRFPEAHLRTNGFMAARELLASLLPVRLRVKAQAYRLESGRHSITRRVRRLGLGVRVVDRFGRSFDPQEWPASATFWQGDQDALMIADNQSDLYERADAEARALLARLAWGERAMTGGR